jgi:hypothetical protein
MLMRSTYLSMALICILVLTTLPTFAQSDQGTAKPGLVDSNLFYVINDNSIASINIISGEQVPRVSLTANLISQSTPTDVISPDIVLTAKIDQSTHLLYVVRGPLTPGDTTPKVTRIEQINLISGASLIVYERQTIVNVHTSPDGSKAIVSYYEGKFADSPLHMCVLSIATGRCTELALIIHSTSSIYWLDEKTLMVSLGGFKLYSIDTSTQQITLLKGLENWYVEGVAPIPQTYNFLVAAVPSVPDGQLNPARLLIYEMDTGRVTDYPYQITSNDVAYLGPDLEVSPNSQYFVVGGYTTLRIVEFKTGRIVTELPKVTQVAWPSDGAHVLVSLTSSETIDTVTSQTMNIDLQTGASTVVFSTTDPGILVVP